MPHTDHDPTYVNVGCGPHRAPPPWTNLDCVRSDTIRPDLVVSAAFPLASFENESVDRVYLGHVLEHTPWDEVPAFLVEVSRVLKPGGLVVAVGPDVYRAIEQFRLGLLNWETAVATLEGSHSSLTEGTTAWPQARHHWNCSQERLVYAMCLVFGNVEALDVAEDDLHGWPVVSYTQWQCAARAVKQ